MSDFVYAIFSLILLAVPQSILLAVPPSILLAVTQSRAQANFSCEIGWDLGITNDCCYKFIQKNAVSNMDARAICRDLDSTIVSIQSKEENDFVGDMFQSRFQSSFIWIGYVAKTSRSDQFVWLDASDSNYTNWQKGEPNNDGGNPEDCAAMEIDADRSYKWHDFSCQSSTIANGFVCKTCNKQLDSSDCFDADNNCFKNGVPECRGRLAYTGTQHQTRSGRECQKWSDQTPHSHRDGIYEPENFCRNPDGDKGPWCFTTDPDKRYERCFNDCEDTPCYDPERDCFQQGVIGCMEQQSYTGERSITRSGRKCDSWSNQTVGSSEAENYCRNPDESAGPWCWTTDESVYEFCFKDCRATVYHCDNDGTCTKCGGKTGVICNGAKYAKKSSCDEACEPLQYHCVAGLCEACHGNTTTLCKTPNYNDSSCDTQCQCQDKNKFCQFWQSIGECEANSNWMMTNCPDACGACPYNKTASCLDSKELCPYWQSKGECKANANWMSLNCRKSCGICEGSGDETVSWICSGQTGSRHCIKCGTSAETPCPVDVKSFPDEIMCNETCD